jgi:acyl-CoA synthetase (AMP-forming)/AMP-acid ligase II/acyl carrier protein
MTASGATVMQATPATWRLLRESGWKGRAGLRVFCGGERLERDLVDPLLAAGMTVWNGYGPTEATIYSSGWHVEPGPGPVVIGRPLANARIHIFDGRMQPVPAGVRGEIFIGGAGLALGYLGRPDLTAERFVPDPFVPGERLYRTGDAGAYRPDGTIDCLGRLDDQVKIRGFRVEPGEVEALLRETPAVAQAAVVARPDAHGDVRLVAYVVAAPDASVDPAALRRHLARLLPEYMVPSAFVSLDTLPLTASGKVDRRSLPEPEAQAAPRAAVADPPRTATEEALVAIWKEVLPVAEVGIRDNFFTLGGHSLLATRVTSRLQQRMGVRLPLASFFQTPTIEALASLVDGLRGANVESAAGDQEEFTL